MWYSVCMVSRRRAQLLTENGGKTYYVYNIMKRAGYFTIYAKKNPGYQINLLSFLNKSWNLSYLAWIKCPYKKMCCWYMKILFKFIHIKLVMETKLFEFVIRTAKHPWTSGNILPNINTFEKVSQKKLDFLN